MREVSISEHVVLVTTSAALTSTQHRDLMDRLAHWVPSTQTVGSELTIEMRWRVNGGVADAKKRARSVVRRVFQDMGVDGRVLRVMSAG